MLLDQREKMRGAEKLDENFCLFTDFIDRKLFFAELNHFPILDAHLCVV